MSPIVKRSYPRIISLPQPDEDPVYFVQKTPWPGDAILRDNGTVRIFQSMTEALAVVKDLGQAAYLKLTHGDRVEYVDVQGEPRFATIVMLSSVPGGYLASAGGRYGTTVLITKQNFKRVIK